MDLTGPEGPRMTEEERKARQAAYQRRYREKRLGTAQEAQKPYLTRNSPELEQLYERKEELEVELDMVNATIKYKEFHSREPKDRDTN